MCGLVAREGQSNRWLEEGCVIYGCTYLGRQGISWSCGHLHRIVLLLSACCRLVVCVVVIFVLEPACRELVVVHVRFGADLPV